ncbi:MULTISPECIES: SLATT domain-containing protein [unclassified Brevundimonas]|uniref:SLATT domain-containing protein n=1 Tax=unclassified Brevundimonas TaxID=2622653 RepID=UPI0025B8D4BD|nr:MULTISPECIES: SLATT domain-containing protein [unclassified Brevundimonas]
MVDTTDASMKAKICSELLRIEEDCTHSGKAHFNAADRWNCYHMGFGIPAVILSALASTAFFNDIPEVAGWFAAAVAILTALQTFLKPSERAAAHKASGDQYLGLRNDARVFREVRLDHICDDQAAIDGLDEFSKRRRELNMASMQFGNSDFKKAKKGIDAGEALHAIDRRS